MEIKLIVPPNFYIANENASPPLQFEPFYNFADLDFIHLKRGDSLDIIPEAEMYGISAYTVDIKMADIISHFLKRRDPNCKIAIGGSHATYRPKEISDIYDFVIIGKGESFIERVIQNNLPTDRIYVGNNRRSEFNTRSFNHFAEYTSSFGSYTLRISYGCYWNCNFCAGANDGMIFRSIDDIEKQLYFLYQKGIYEIRLIDETITEHPDFKIICKMLQPFKWVAQTRLNLLTDENVRMMKDNRCTGLQVGIESFVEEVRQKLNKHLSDKELQKGIKIANENNLKLYGFIMLNTPYDTVDTIKQTVEAHWTFNIYNEIRAAIFCPLPGTQIGDNPQKYNLRVLMSDYEYYSTILFQNIHGKLVSVPTHVSHIASWEKFLWHALYTLSPQKIKEILDNPITTWYDSFSSK